MRLDAPGPAISLDAAVVLEEGLERTLGSRADGYGGRSQFWLRVRADDSPGFRDHARGPRW